MLIFINCANNSGGECSYRKRTLGQIKFICKLYVIVKTNRISYTVGHLPPFPDPEGDVHTPNIFTPSPFSSSALPACKASSRPRELDEADSLIPQHVLDSTEILKGGEEQLLNSCESAKTICVSQDVVDEVPHTSTISMGEEQEAETEHAGSVSTDSVGEEALRRPDSLKGIQSFPRSHSDLASLGLAFPAQNSSMAVARWPSITDRTAPDDDVESYTYSPGYDRTHSKASDR